MWSTTTIWSVPTVDTGNIVNKVNAINPLSQENFDEGNFHYGKPFLDALTQKWMSYVCSHPQLMPLTHPLFESGSVLTCTTFEPSKVLQFKDIAPIEQAASKRNKVTRMSVMETATYHIADNQEGRYLMSSLKLTNEWKDSLNYTNVMSPLMMRYSGMSKKSARDYFAGPGLSPERESVEIVRDLDNPNFLTTYFLYIRTKDSGLTEVSQKYQQKYLFYFDEERIKSTNKPIIEVISRSKSQLTLLTLIIIIIISSIVMCISFK